MESRTSARKVKRQERARQALELRKGGLTQTQIAERLGVEQSTISEDLRLAFAEYQKEYAAEAVHFARLDLLRLDALIAAVWPGALTGEPKAVNCVKGLLERRAKMLGLDAVQHVLLTAQPPQTEALDAILKRLEKETVGPVQTNSEDLPQ